MLLLSQNSALAGTEPPAMRADQRRFDFTFPIFDGVKPVALLPVRTSIPVLVRWCVGMLVCCYAGMWIDHHAFQRLLGLPSETTDTNTVVFSFRTCIILSSNALRTFAAPNDSTRKARAAIVSRL